MRLSALQFQDRKSLSERLRLSDRESLSRKAVNVAGWTIAQTGATYALRLASNLIMTRLLMPEAFGLLGMAVMVMVALALFTDIGIGPSVTREPDGDRPEFLRVAWTVKILRGLVISGGVLIVAAVLWKLGPAFAPPGTVYEDPRLAGLIALTALSPLLAGLESTSRDLAGRRMDFRIVTLTTIGCQAASILAMICFALFSPTVWALMAGMLTSNLLFCLATHLFFSGPSMRLAWNTEIAGRLWTFGKWIIVSSMFTFLGLNGDKLILGALLGASDFGLYVIALVWLEAGTSLIRILGDRIGFPAVSHVIRTRPHDLRRVFRKYQIFTDVLCVSAFLFLFLEGQRLIDLLYTDHYAPAGAYLQIMALAFLTLRFDTLNSLLLNLGDSRATALVAATRAVALCTLLPVANLLFGITGALVVSALVPGITVPYVLGRLRPDLGERMVQVQMFWLGVPVLAALGVLTFG
ncbi:oligosaccharide flippase family protein [Rhodobacter sp. CZR27]|uniref:oligosaccharide flippase family protein n=1 Tax=Rhodobacter sp. CZR27 TaxID=2033869 RepID=UPI000BBF0E58|nr:oligosaccharide flippase family protein [Rhodobacter sp. CZR27]